MAKKRNRLQIIYDILKTIKMNPSIKRTHLMYKTNLTYIRLASYLDELEKKKLVVIGDEIHLTTEGKAFLDHVGKMQKFVDSFGL
ncbi:hypothetical protein COT72_02200 [archaeon CG10_big_fil_rev_8_21_14_0_10_43_11]|nr:MAG: hypothetical protein COT72_02200 [archaeon CG10_big_fil_rev_8_21_14_0_10_43_11]